MKMWHVKYRNGESFEVRAAKFDQRTNSFMNEKDEVVCVVNMADVLYVKLGKEPKVEQGS